VLATLHLPSAIRRIKSQFHIFLTPIVAEMIVIALLLGVIR
jgi:hypothetical protein